MKLDRHGRLAKRLVLLQSAAYPLSHGKHGQKNRRDIRLYFHGMVAAHPIGYANLYLDNPSGVVPGKSFTVFVDVPQGSNWTSVNAFVQDGPGKSYRWTQRGYKREQVIAGEWNSIVVPVPSDFSASGSRVGIDLQISGPGAIKLYSDAVFLAN